MQGTPAIPSFAVAALALVVALVLLIGRLARSTTFNRFRAPSLARSGPRLAILDTLALDRTRRLHVIQWQGRSLMLLTGGPSDQVVGWVPNAGEPQ